VGKEEVVGEWVGREEGVRDGMDVGCVEG